ncbi:MAG: PAC2 family protein [Mycobacteriales bacterium]
MVIRPQDLVEVVAEASGDGSQPVLVHAMHGFIDAGSGGRIAAEHLLSTLDNTMVARFDIDLLMDYRSRRPAMVFEDQAFTAYEEPLLAVHRVLDAVGVPFLLLSGPEPDLMWLRFVDAVDHLLDVFGVRLTVGLTAIPWATPHTRSLGVIAHSADPALVQGYEAFGAAVRVPGHVDVLLEQRLGERGRATMGFAGQVPHYLSQVEYPDAAASLLHSLAGATGLQLPSEPLVEAGVEVRRVIDAQIAESEETLSVVHVLEEQYDAQMRARASGADASDSDLSTTTGDDLAAQFERFLAERDRGSGAN